MLPAPAQLYKCPHCGKTKPMLSLMSGNTLGGELWSDGRTIYPMLPRISAIQKCPKCGKYSFFKQWKNRGRSFSKEFGTTGELSYSDAKEAFKDLSHSSSNNQRSYEIALFFVHAFNDEFRRPKLREAIGNYKHLSTVSGSFPSPSEEDGRLFFEASKSVIENTINTKNAQILKAEMHRERGEWIEAFEILYQMQAGNNQWIVDTILYYTCQRDSSLIPFMVGGKKLDYSNKPNFRTLSLPEEPEVVEERKNKIEEYLSNVSCVTKRDLYYDILGGVYDKSTNTLLQLVQPSQERYEIEDETRNIGSFAFYRNEQLKRVRLSSELKSIGIKAFYGCKNLSTVFNQKSAIEVIEECAFMNCKSLTTINFIDYVKFIGRSAFAGMDKLQSISLSNYLVDIQEFTFFECESLRCISIPTSVRFIASYAFQHTALTELEIPDSVVTLGDAVFSRCFNLEKVKLSSLLVSIPERTFDSCKSLREIEIPQNVECIEQEAFSGTVALEKIRFHGKVKSISESAFKNSGLKEIIVPLWTKGHYKKLFPNVKITTKIF